jgi:uncharacterized protein YndB with AHSA1/START domain
MQDLKQNISIKVDVNANIDKVWKLWTTAADIMQWNNPTNEWHSPRVEIDLKNQGNFFFRMETKDGSVGFDHAGKYDIIIKNELIQYTGTDGRESSIRFTDNGTYTNISETFVPEDETPLDIQQNFVLSILNNFKKYAEGKYN